MDIRDQIEQLGGRRPTSDDLAEATRMSTAGVARYVRADWSEEDRATNPKRKPAPPGQEPWSAEHAVRIARHMDVSPTRLLVLRGELTEVDVVLAAAGYQVSEEQLREHLGGGRVTQEELIAALEAVRSGRNQGN